METCDAATSASARACPERSSLKEKLLKTCFHESEDQDQRTEPDNHDGRIASVGSIVGISLLAA